MNLRTMAAKAKASCSKMAMASSLLKNQALEVMAHKLSLHKEHILQANREDMDLAKKSGLSEAMLDRLSLQNRLDGIIGEIKEVVRLPDPVGELFDEQLMLNQLHVVKCRTPIGVLGVIYESRPNVTIDVSALAIKSGNCAILRGGSETLHTNRVLVDVIQKAIVSVGLPQEAVQLIATPDREKVQELLSLHEYVDLIIPRGGARLQEFCRENSKIPVIFGGIGICHLFVDASADIERSLKVIGNAKIQRPMVCNALDTLLVHAEIAPVFIPKVIEELGKQGVIFRVDLKASTFAPGCPLAEDGDWDREWLSLVLGIKVVATLDEAIEHIRLHSTAHSDGILTEDKENAEAFVQAVDSAAVYVNASTRFTDGAQMGLGSEVANSTQKLHARGPMGLKELTTYKWIIRGDYHVRK